MPHQDAEQHIYIGEDGAGVSYCVRVRESRLMIRVIGLSMNRNDSDPASNEQAMLRTIKRSPETMPRT